jgi:class 3 adenylate cyclase
MPEIVIGLILGATLVALYGMRGYGRRRRMARHPAPTFVFADLVGFTALTEAHGDETAARVAREFGRAMSALSREHGAWPVKSLGDGAMIWVPDAGQAVELAARALAEVGTRPDLLPMRVGTHTGTAVMHGWDWYGNAVNVAARLAAEAEPGQALISHATDTAAGGRERLPRARCEVVLPGVEQPIMAWRLGPAGGAAPAGTSTSPGCSPADRNRPTPNDPPPTP